jgi:hypothetical protein
MRRWTISKSSSIGSPHNERLQKKVKAQYKLIVRKTANLEGHILPLRIVKAWKPIGGHGFKFDGSVENVTELPWYDEYGFTWWLSTVGADHLQYCLEKSKVQLVNSRNKLEECDVTISMTKLEIKYIEEHGPDNDKDYDRDVDEFRNQIQRWLELPIQDRTYWENELSAKIDKKNQVVEEWAQLLSEKWDLLIVLHEEKARLEFDLLDLQRRQERQKALLDLVQTLLTLPHFGNLSVEFANQLYFTLAFNYQYQHLRNITANIQQSTEFLRSDRLGLLGLLEDYYELSRLKSPRGNKKCPGNNRQNTAG